MSCQSKSGNKLSSKAAVDSTIYKKAYFSQDSINVRAHQLWVDKYGTTVDYAVTIIKVSSLHRPGDTIRIVDRSYILIK